MTTYEVLSPVMTEVVPVPGCNGDGPREEFRCYVVVRGAPTRAQAKWTAFRSAEFRAWRDEQAAEQVHPLHGFEVVDVGNDPDFVAALAEGSPSLPCVAWDPAT